MKPNQTAPKTISPEKRKTCNFTLIELLVVIAIIAILAACRSEIFGFGKSMSIPIDA